jgi:hypothetical protein
MISITMSSLVLSFILMFVLGMLLISLVFGLMHNPTSSAQIDLANLTVRNTMDLDINSNSSMAEAPLMSPDQELPSPQGGSAEAPLMSPDQELPSPQGGLDQQHRQQQAQQR